MSSINQFGLTVARFRSEKGLSQEELAYESEIHRNTIQRIEGGSIPKIDKVEPLCSALNVTPNELFGYEDNQFSGLDPSLVAAIRQITGIGREMPVEKQKMLAALLQNQAGLLI